jgi:hypothetical protein
VGRLFRQWSESLARSTQKITDKDEGISQLAEQLKVPTPLNIFFPLSLRINKKLTTLCMKYIKKPSEFNS